MAVRCLIGHPIGSQTSYRAHRSMRRPGSTCEKHPGSSSSCETHPFICAYTPLRHLILVCTHSARQASKASKRLLGRLVGKDGSYVETWTCTPRYIQARLRIGRPCTAAARSRGLPSKPAWLTRVKPLQQPPTNLGGARRMLDENPIRLSAVFFGV